MLPLPTGSGVIHGRCLWGESGDEAEDEQWKSSTDKAAAATDETPSKHGFKVEACSRGDRTAANPAFSGDPAACW